VAPKTKRQPSAHGRADACPEPAQCSTKRSRPGSMPGSIAPLWSAPEVLQTPIPDRRFLLLQTQRAPGARNTIDGHMARHVRRVSERLSCRKVYRYYR
jgi:hypothetical protein